MDPEETITITMTEYLKLKDDSTLLDAFYAVGVEDWEDYELAKEEHGRLLIEAHAHEVDMADALAAQEMEEE